jgi:di/tricarboxylate transporter
MEKEYSRSSTSNVDVDDESLLRMYHKPKRDRSWQIYRAMLRRNVVVLCVALILALMFAMLGLFVPVWQTLSWQGWFTLYTTLLVLIVLVKNWLPAEFVFWSALALLFVAQIIDSAEALEGFSNSGLMTVAALFIVAKGVELSDVLRYFIRYVLRQPKTLLDAQLRLLVPVTVLSGFLNNTPIVAMLIPVVESWSRQCQLPISRLMLPLSYAAILGGTSTLIGTSTNLIVEGLVQQSDPSFHIGFFEIGIVGAPAAVIGLIYIFVFSRFLLPANVAGAGDERKRRPSAGQSAANAAAAAGDNQDGDGETARLLKPATPSDAIEARHYSAALRVTRHARVVRQTIAQSGLTMIPGLRLLSVRPHASSTAINDRAARRVMSPPSDGYVLSPGDLLIMSGLLDSLQTAYSIDGLVPATSTLAQVSGARVHRVLAEAVIGADSHLAGQTIAEADFPLHYNAAVIAVHLPSMTATFSHVGEAQAPHFDRENNNENDDDDDEGNGDDDDDNDDIILLSGEQNRNYGSAPPVESSDSDDSDSVAVLLDERAESMCAFNDLTLEAGAIVLLETTQAFVKHHRHDRTFALVRTAHEGSLTPRRRISFRMVWVVSLAVAMVALSTANVAPLLPLSIAVGCLYVLTGCMSWEQALESVKPSVLLIIAAAFALGNALDRTKAADVISQSLLSVFSLGGELGVLFGLYLTTALLSAVISNAATVTLMWPIAQSFAAETGIALRAIVFTLMLAGSASFATPIGYQTNLLVMRWASTKDFLVMGVPLTIVEMIFSCIMVWLIWA